ncbi:MAG: FmdB family transcriptional regulator [Microbacteriaceae bacterium]|nr:FmdB family transcriptional regulator [Microbacteriaceae bacterium]HOB58285.1 zinc ribbon domain-containing protein [Rhodoglobus sp.]HOT34214.1 zinc ribbon domain-containing protein [Rhodoglobus sp.]HOY81354.1 zinc ribbon domain-containing protein [Rhodoglobus sp.]HQA23426.1 zinc ribbon domain-containing protein [Rhodoglobus sp.]
MPTYSYRCTECSNAFDIHQSFTDDSLTVCPTCGGVLRKVFSPVGVTFSGSGFYRTDSRAPAKSEGSGSSSSASSASASDSGSSSTPAPAAAKTEKKSSTPASSGSASGGTSS